MAGKLTAEEQFRLAQEEDTFSISTRDVEEQYAFSDEIIEEYEKIGLIGRKRPVLQDIHTRILGGSVGDYYDGSTPTVVRQLSLDEVSALHSLLTNWYGYLGAQFAVYSARRNEARKKKEVSWSIIRNNYRKIGREYGVSYTDQKLSDFARQDSRFLPLDAEYEKLNAIYNTLGALLEVTKKEVESISREVTIRQVKAESEARGRGMANRVAPSTVRVPERRGRVSIGDATPKNIKSKIRKGIRSHK